MNDKNSLESFISDIDKIVFGESNVLFECEHGDVEYKELLFLAQVLVKADYSQESQGLVKKVISKMQKNGEMEDDELDMVAGGININIISDEKGKKAGI
ncbi:hypothetical protein JCM14036_29480 [Desulfotomaculum defluvii]